MDELYVHGNFVAVEEKISLEMRKIEYRVGCSIMHRNGDHLDNLMDCLRNVQLPLLRREQDCDLVKKRDWLDRAHLCSKGLSHLCQLRKNMTWSLVR